MSSSADPCFDVYGSRGISFVRAAGSCYYDDRNRRYLDFHSGHGVMNLGHGLWSIGEAVSSQYLRLPNVSGAFGLDIRKQLMARLVALSQMGGARVFLCNSGTESVEAALKFARLHTGREKIVGVIRGFHGRTFGALSAGFNPHHRRGCGSMLPGCTHVPFDDLDRLSATLDGETAALILEVVQGEGGVRPASAAYLRRAESLCRERGILLIIDEVQTGFGRTGTVFAYQRFGLSPDILCLAKALGGGFPIGATLFTSAIRPAKGMHGCTFGGNPLSCAAAMGFLDYFDSRFPDLEVDAKGQYLAECLRACRSVKQVRHLGLMVGADLIMKAGLAVRRLQDAGLLVLAAGPMTLRLLPPLTISWPELREAAGILLSVLDVGPPTGASGQRRVRAVPGVSC